MPDATADHRPLCARCRKRRPRPNRVACARCAAVQSRRDRRYELARNPSLGHWRVWLDDHGCGHVRKPFGRMPGVAAACWLS